MKLQNSVQQVVLDVVFVLNLEPGPFAVPDLKTVDDGLLTASDSRGRLIASKMAWPRAGMSTIVADLPLGTGPTLYTRIGDVFDWICIALTLAIGAAARLRRTA